MEWLTPALATALGAAIAAFAALIGVLVKGSLDQSLARHQLDQQRRLATQQLEVQRELVVEQIKAQERIASANRAEDRALTMQSERRARYGEVIEHAGEVAAALRNQENLLANPAALFHPTIDQLAEIAVASARREVLGEHEPKESQDSKKWHNMVAVSEGVYAANRALSSALVPLELIAPSAVAQASRKLRGNNMVFTSNSDQSSKATHERKRQQDELDEFTRLCRMDLNGALAAEEPSLREVGHTR